MVKTLHTTWSPSRLPLLPCLLGVALLSGSSLPANAGSSACLEILPAPVAAEAATPPPPGTLGPDPPSLPPVLSPGADATLSIPGPGEAPPPAPPATPPGEPSTGYMEPAFPGEPAEGRVVIEGRSVSMDGAGNLHASGKVLIRSVQYTLEGDSATLDRAREWAELSGHVRLQGKAIDTRADGSVRANLKTGEWHLSGGGTAVLSPEFFPGGEVTDRLYLRTQEASTPREDAPLDLRGTRLTSCNQERPHYAFESRRIEIRPGDQVLVERPEMYLVGERLFRLPFDLVLFLDEKRNQYLPEVGHNDVEGYYAKFAYGYLVGNVGRGTVRLNLTSERGVALGLLQRIDSPRQSGEGSILWEPKEKSLSGRLTHRLELSSEWTSNLDASYQNNSGYFGDTTTLSGNLLFSRHTSSGDLQVGYQNSLYETSFGTTRRWTTSFTDRQRFGANSSMSLRALWQDQDFGGSALPSRSLDTSFEFSHRTKTLDYALLASHLFEPDLAPGQQRRYALNRQPELTVRTDSSRLGNYRLLGKVPFQTYVTLGEYEQQPADLSVFRGTFDATLGGVPEDWDSRTRATTTARFRQSLFGDTSAQYLIDGDFDLRRELGRFWQTRLHWRHSEVHGYQPIALDYGSRTDVLRWETVHARADRTRLYLATGYDLIGGFWQNLTLTGEWMPSPRTKLSLQTSYDVERGRMLPLGLIWKQVDTPRYYLSLAGEYDAAGIGLTRVSGELDWQFNPLWRLSMVSSYSGYSKQIDTMSVQLQRDLHCLVGSVGYNLELNQVSVSLGIKAFPNSEQALGIGRTGAQFQTLPGQYF